MTCLTLCRSVRATTPSVPVRPDGVAGRSDVRTGGQATMHVAILPVFPSSLVRYSAKHWSLKGLPVDLGQVLPVVIVTLKNRTLTPSVRFFLDEVRAATKAMPN